MRGDDAKQEAMFSYVSPERRVPADHPLRAVREMVGAHIQIGYVPLFLMPFHAGELLRESEFPKTPEKNFVVGCMRLWDI